jgi:hypothetical protein
MGRWLSERQRWVLRKKKKNFRKKKPGPARATLARGRGILAGGNFPSRARARGNPPRDPVRVT